MSRRRIQNRIQIIAITLLLVINTVIILYIVNSYKYNQKIMAYVFFILTIVTSIYTIITLIRKTIMYDKEHLYEDYKYKYSHTDRIGIDSRSSKQTTIFTSLDNEYRFFPTFFKLLEKVIISSWLTILIIYVLDIVDLRSISNAIKEQFLVVIRSEMLQILFIIPAIFLLIYVFIPLIWKIFKNFSIIAKNIYFKFVVLSILESSSRILIISAILYSFPICCIDNQNNPSISNWIVIPFGIVIFLEILYLIVNIIKHLPHARN